MSKRTLVLAVVIPVATLVAHGLIVLAQTPTPPGKYIASAEWKKALDDSKPALGIVAGQTATILPGAPEIIVRRRLDGPNNASVHTKEGDGQDVTEVYQILEGSGTYVTGGTIPDPKNRTAGIRGGESHDVKPGDFIIIPPGTAHWFSKINGQITYVETRIPGNVLKR